MSEETCSKCIVRVRWPYEQVPTESPYIVVPCPRHAKVAELERQVAQLREALEDCIYDQYGEGTPAEYTVWAAAKKALDATGEQPKETT